MKYLQLFFILSCASRCYSSAAHSRIAIIGGGIGGTSCAYFLRSLLGDSAVLDLYEAESVGGRLSVISFGGKKYEVGGSIIHSRNKYMSGFLKLFNLKKRQRSSDSYVGLYNGKEFVFEESTWQIVTLYRLIRRYRFGILKLKGHIDKMLDSFEKIYEWQDNGVWFHNVSSLLSAMDPKFVEYLQLSSKKGFEDEGLSENVIDELIMATIRTNYGQDLNIHKFVGSVSVAGADGRLWAFDGGNAQVPEKLLHLSKASLIHSAVKTIRRLPSNEIEILASAKPNESKGGKKKYDIVIVAAPQTKDMKHPIIFENFKKNIEFSGRYHQTVCTLIQGRLSDSYFHNKKNFIDSVLSVEQSLFFNSIGRINPVDYQKKLSKPSDVWKIFSQRLLTDSELNALFSEVKDKYVKVWLAYPEYDTSLRNDMFELDDNLYHINAIDWAASSMEMSVIGAKNVALLAVHKWRGNVSDRNCTENCSTSSSTERNEL